MNGGKFFLAAIAFGIAGALNAAEADDDGYRPHTPTLVFHLTDAGTIADTEAIRASVGKVASVSKVIFAPGVVQVRFDSHVVSYHQVAQAIADAGASRGKNFDPTLKLIVADYAKTNNAAKVDAVLAGKRLNQRVRIEASDKLRGEFLLHFLPLTLDAADPAPQGFNGGHLHHPISDPPPRGLGIACSYEFSTAAAH